MTRARPVSPGFTPLILAATAGHVVVVEILLDKGGDIEAQSERTKDTPLSLACSGGRQEVSKTPHSTHILTRSNLQSAFLTAPNLHLANPDCLFTLPLLTSITSHCSKLHPSDILKMCHTALANEI